MRSGMNDIVAESVRDKILALIASINPHDALEQQHINDTISWIKSDEQIFRISKPDNLDKR